MAITLDALTKSTSATFQHTCSGTERFLVVVASYVPSIFQETLSIKYAGIEMVLHSVLVEKKLAMCMGCLASPPEGTHDAEVTMSAPATMLCKAVSFNGVSQSDPMWGFRDGVGAMVTQIPVNTFSRIDGMTLGVGAVNDVEAGNDKLYGNQVLAWDDSETELRMDGIYSIGTSDQDTIPLPNKLTKAAYWTLVIVGINHA